MIARTPSGSVKTSARRAAQKRGHAMPGGGFPIEDAKDLSNAKHDIGRAKNPAAARRWINKRAKEMGEPGVGESKKRGGKVEGEGKRPHLGRAGRARREEGGRTGELARREYPPRPPIAQEATPARPAIAPEPMPPRPAIEGDEKRRGGRTKRQDGGSLTPIIDNRLLQGARNVTGDYFSPPTGGGDPVKAMYTDPNYGGRWRDAVEAANNAYRPGARVAPPRLYAKGGKVKRAGGGFTHTTPDFRERRERPPETGEMKWDEVIDQPTLKGEDEKMAQKLGKEAKT